MHPLLSLAAWMLVGAVGAIVAAVVFTACRAIVCGNKTTRERKEMDKAAAFAAAQESFKDVDVTRLETQLATLQTDVERLKELGHAPS